MIRLTKIFKPSLFTKTALANTPNLLKVQFLKASLVSKHPLFFSNQFYFSQTNNFNNPQEIRNLLNEGIALSKTGENDKALEILKNATNTLNSLTLSSDHGILSPELSQLYSNIVKYLDQKGDEKEAEIHAKKGIELLGKLKGEEDVILYPLMEWCFVKLVAQGRGEEFFPLAIRYKSVLTKKFGKDSYHVNAVSLYIAAHLFMQGDLIGAGELYEETEKFLAKNPQYRAEFVKGFEYDLTIARYYGAIKKWKEADEYFEKSLQEALRKHGEISHNTALCYLYGATLLTENMDKHDEVKKRFEKALDIYHKIGEKECLGLIIQTLHNYGSFLAHFKENKEALKLFQKALDHCKDFDPSQFVSLELLYANLGTAQVDEDMIEEGLENLIKAIDLCEKDENKSGCLEEYQGAFSKGLSKLGAFAKVKYTVKRYF